MPVMLLLEALKIPGRLSYHPSDLLSLSAHRFLTYSEEEVRSQMEVNYYGPLRTLRAVLPSMRAKGSGQIVLISSGAG